MSLPPYQGSAESQSSERLIGAIRMPSTPVLFNDDSSLDTEPLVPPAYAPSTDAPTSADTTQVPPSNLLQPSRSGGDAAILPAYRAVEFDSVPSYRAALQQLPVSAHDLGAQPSQPAEQEGRPELNGFTETQAAITGVAIIMSIALFYSVRAPYEIHSLGYFSNSFGAS
jgi:hypothetical protein